MNSIVTRPIAFPLLVTLCMTVLLLPLAFWQQSWFGLKIVASAASVVLLVVVLTAIAQRFLPDLTHQQLKQLALVGGLRMGLSLVAVLAACFAARQFARPEVLLYAVPFYLGLLAAETAVMVAQIRKETGGIQPALR